MMCLFNFLSLLRWRLYFLLPKLKNIFLWVPDYFKLRDIISVTCAAYVFVLPFILYKMGNLSFVALPANFLVLPFIPFTMILGFLTGFAGFVSHTLAVPLGFLSYLFLRYELAVINFLHTSPLPHFLSLISHLS